MNSPPPLFNSTVFNANAFNFTNYLTKTQADNYYVSDFILPASAGTAQASKLLLLDASTSIVGINQIGATTLTLSGTTASTSSSTGAFQCAGGGYFGNDSIMNTKLTINGLLQATNAISLTNTSTNAVLTLNSAATTGARSNLLFVTDAENWEYGARGSTMSNPNSLYWYNGGFLMLMNSTGDVSMLSSTSSSSTTTGCLKLSGGLGIAGNTFGTQFTSTASGSHYSLVNGANSALIELATSPSVLRLVKGYGLTISSSGILIANGASAAAKCPLDLGSTSSNMILSLFNDGVSYYGLSANNSTVQYSSNSGHSFYTGCTPSSPINTLLGTLSSGGNLSCTSGFYTGFTSTGPSGPGVKIHYGASLGAVFGYDYTAGTPIALELGYTTGGNYHFLLTTTSANAWTNVNSINTTGSCPLAIYGSGNFTRSTGAYGYLNSTAVGNTGSASWTHAMSLYCQYGILCDGGEIDTFSDVRAKENITPLDESMVNRLMSIEPIAYNYIGNTAPKLGYRAQDLLAGMLPDLINFTKIHDEENYLPEMDVECDDGSTVHLTKDEKLIVNIIGVIPILHKALQMQNDRIEQNEKAIADLIALLKAPDVLKVNTNEDNLKPEEAASSPIAPEVAITKDAPLVYQRKCKKIIKRLI